MTKNPNAIEYFRQMWTSLLKQKMTLVCFGIGSDEIAGISVNYVKCKEDKFWEELDQQVSLDINRLKFLIQHLFIHCILGWKR